MDDLRRWNERHRIPVLYVTHSHREVYALGERVIVLEQGRVIATGSPHDVLDQPVAAHARQPRRIRERLRRPPSSSVTERAGTMRCRLDGAATELEVPLTRHGPAIASASPSAPATFCWPRRNRMASARATSSAAASSSMTAQGPTVVATIDAGARFVVHLTPGAAEALRSQPGARSG